MSTYIIRMHIFISLNQLFSDGTVQVDVKVSSFYIRNFKPLASLCGCTGRFVSYLIANRFFRDEAHIVKLGFRYLIFMLCISDVFEK